MKQCLNYTLIVCTKINMIIPQTTIYYRVHQTGFAEHPARKEYKDLFAQIK